MSYICSIKLKTVINMETKKFAEENAGKFFMYEGERCRLVGIEGLEGLEGAPNPCLVIEKKDGWLAHPLRFKQVWNGKVERAWYVTKEQLIPTPDVSARQFAEDNAGRYYTFNEDGIRVRVVGYRSNDQVIITRRKGWLFIGPEDKFTCETKAKRFWYATVDSLKEIPLC